MQKNKKLNNLIKPIRFQIIFLSFHKKRLIKFCNIFKQILSNLKIYSKNELNFSGPLGIPQKIYKICVIKSPFVYKKSQELFEIRTFKQIIILNSSFLLYRMILALLLQIKKKIPSGIDMKIKIIN